MPVGLLSFAFSTICLIKVSQKMVGLVDKFKGVVHW